MNRNFFILLILLVSHNLLQSEQLDEAFIKSLPSNLQADFLAQSEDMDNEDKNIPSPETRINNLEEALAEAEQTLKKIKQDLGEQQNANNQALRRIGENFFQTFQSTFLPINEPNADSTYILDAGDRLTLQLIGQKNLTSKLTIKRNGAINIPDIGDVTLAGLSLQEASELIRKLIAQAFIGVDAFISLTELRDINVLIVGNILKPGMYTLSGGSSPLSLLYAAGGLDENGSYRDVTHKRNNVALQSIDLYEVLLKGNFSFSHQLRSGDVLVVNPKHAEIRVSGSFANPGIYELLPSENLGDLINYAGIQKKHINTSISIERYIANKIDLFNIPLSNIEAFELLDGDAVSLLGSVPQFNRTKTVTITGEVGAPGVYRLDDNATILDLIRISGSYTERAYPEGGILIRESLKDIENASKEKSYNELLRYLVASPNFSSVLSSSNGNGIVTFLGILKDYEPVGRVVSEFSLAKLSNNPYLNRTLEDGDQVHIPSFTPDVFLFGEIMNPGSVPYEEMDDPFDYISNAGGLSRVADQDRIILISPNGRVQTLSRSRFKIFSNSALVLPGSTIYVPREIGKLDGINLASAIAPVISSVALSLASLNAINN